MDGTGFGLLAIVAVILVIAVFVIALVTRYYHRVPPSQVMVVYGRAQRSRLITNGGVFIVPIVESYKVLDLTIMTIKTENDEVYTVSGVPIQLDWVAQVQVDSEEAALRTASKAFLDKSRDEIHSVIKETLSANFRAIVGQMTVEAIHRDRDDFVQKVQDLASDDVAAMGVKVISMGIEEITDDEGYLQAMAEPQIAAIKRDARIAQAEADREARVKAANAKREAEQAELDAEREILEQREALQLREVEVERQVGLAQAESNQAVEEKRALAVEQQQIADILVPARAEREATEIRSEAEKLRVTISAEADANATRQRADAEAEATEKRGRADAIALQAHKEAEAEGIRANLLAEATGRREIAAASAAEGEINLRQFVIEQITNAEIEKAKAVANAMAGLGENVRIVQFGQNGQSSTTGNTLMDLLLSIPEVSEMFTSKVEALTGEDFEQTLNKTVALLNTIKSSDMQIMPMDETPTSAMNGESETD